MPESASRWGNDDEFWMRVGPAIKEIDGVELCEFLECAGWFDSPCNPNKLIAVKDE